VGTSVQAQNLSPKSKDSQEWSAAAQRLLESAIEQNLAMTYEQRIEAHENARQLMNDLRDAGKELHGAESQGPA
jgi:hypothetical protein